MLVLIYYSQPETEEKTITYDNIGPSVCMGDHKVCNPDFVMNLCVSMTMSLWLQMYGCQHVSECVFEYDWEYDWESVPVILAESQFVWLGVRVPDWGGCLTRGSISLWLQVSLGIDGCYCRSKLYMCKSLQVFTVNDYISVFYVTKFTISLSVKLNIFAS